MSNLPIGITLPFRLGTQGYFEQSFDTVTQLKSNMVNWFLTMKGERPLNPLFGTELFSEIFLPNDEDDTNAICEKIIRTEMKQMFPIIDLKSVNFKRSFQNDNIYSVDITMSFIVVGILTQPTQISVTLTNSIS